MMKKYVISLIAVSLAMGMNACNDDAGTPNKPECNPATGDCIDSECKCGDNSPCPNNDINQCLQQVCKCEDGTDCPGGKASNCTTTGTCKCEDGTDCPGGEASNCATTGTCKCWNGIECPGGNINNCPQMKAEIILDKDNLVIDEGSDAVNEFLLATKPAADVTVTITSEGSCTISPDSIIITPTDYIVPGEFTVSATDDDSTEDKTCKVSVKASSTDTDYDGKEADVTYTIKNTDVPALILSLDSTTIREPLDYSSEPESVTACIKLSLEPKKDVVVKVSYTMSSFMRYSFASNGEDVHNGTISIPKSKYNADDNCIKIYAWRDYKINDDSEPAKMMFQADENDLQSEYYLKKAFGNIYIKNIDSYDYNLEDSDKNVLSFENSLLEGEEITFKPVLMANPGKTVRIKAESSNPDVLTIYQDGAVSKKYVDVSSGSITPHHSFVVKAKKDNTVAEIPPVKITFTVESEDENFSSIEAKEYTFNISDADSPSILMSCVPSEVQNIRGTDCAYGSQKEFEGGFVRCSVRLGSKPTQNVDVIVEAPEEDGYDTAKLQFTFTPSNYNKPQDSIFRFRQANLDKISVYGESQISAYVANPTNYNAPKVYSEKFERFFDCEYRFFGFTGDVGSAYLRKGTYDLYAWGASGSPADAKNMKLVDNKLVCKNRGGTGAFVRGTLNLSWPKNIFVYVGESGKSKGTSYNGGGAGSDHKDVGKRGMSGGGATDFCISDANCKDITQHYESRILVAGGGGGGHAPDSCWTSTDEYRGGDAEGFNSKGQATRTDGAYGWSFGMTYYLFNASYFAPPGGATQYWSDTTYYEHDESHWDLFGVGQSAKEDFKTDFHGDKHDCSDVFLSGDYEFWRHGGGGGGWFGGMSANWICLKSIGGGAGSSYAGATLTDIASRDQAHYSEGLFPRLSIDDKHRITGLETLDNKAQIPCGEYGCYGNVGHGYALIRAHKLPLNDH